MKSQAKIDEFKHQRQLNEWLMQILNQVYTTELNSNIQSTLFKQSALGLPKN